MLLPLLLRHDERVLHLLAVRRRRSAVSAMRGITHLGDAWFTVAVALGLALGAAPGFEAAGLRAAFALTVSHLWVQLLKRSVSRPRPSLPPGTASLVDPPDRFSFPSGHAAAAVSVALPVAFTLPVFAALALVALAIVVGCSRCYLGVHYPSDVVVGWALGALAAALAGPALQRVALSPALF